MGCRTSFSPQSFGGGGCQRCAAAPVLGAVFWWVAPDVSLRGRGARLGAGVFGWRDSAPFVGRGRSAPSGCLVFRGVCCEECVGFCVLVLRRQLCRFAALAGLFLLSWSGSFVASLSCVGVFCAAAVFAVCVLLGFSVVGLPGRLRPVAVPYLGRRRWWAALGAGSGFPVVCGC